MMTSRNHRSFAPRVLAAVLATLGFAAHAEDSLARIKARNTIVLGVRDAARPFSYLDEQKQSVGYSVDLCLNAVDDIKRAIKAPDLKVEYKVVSGAERIPKLVAGEIDMECGSTTNTRARQEKVDFSYTIFVASMRVLAPTAVALRSVDDLKNLPIALSKGTTSEKLFNQLAKGSLAGSEFKTFDSNPEAYKALKSGAVKAFPQDDSLLTALASNDHALDTLHLSEFALSVEPYGIMVRKDDKALLALIDRSLTKVYASGEIDRIYNKWFTTPKLTIRMGRWTRDCFTLPTKEPGVALMLGYSI